MAYIYRHIRLDKNIPFYIGMGSDTKGNYTRAYRKDGRNLHWLSIVAKCGYEVEIMMDDLTWEQACNKEREFIKLYGIDNEGSGCLVNLTYGGDSFIGVRQTEEKKKKISETLKRIYASGERKKARLGTKWSDETREKNRIAHIGFTHTEESKKKMSILAMGNKKNLGKKLSEERKRKIGLGNKGKKHSDEQNRKSAEFNRGRKHSEETKSKMSISQTGRKHTEESKLKISNTHKGMKHTLESRLKMSLNHKGGVGKK